VPAITAMRWNPVLRAFADRLQNSGQRPKYLAVMRWFLALAYGALNSGKAFGREFSS
jgi:transposase